MTPRSGCQQKSLQATPRIRRLSARRGWWSMVGYHLLCQIAPPPVAAKTALILWSSYGDRMHTEVVR